MTAAEFMGLDLDRCLADPDAMPVNAMSVIGFACALFLLVSWPIVMYTDTGFARWARRQADSNDTTWAAIGALLAAVPCVQVGLLAVTVGCGTRSVGSDIDGLVFLQIGLLVLVSFAIAIANRTSVRDNWKAPKWLDYRHVREARGFSDAGAKTGVELAQTVLTRHPRGADGRPLPRDRRGGPLEFLMDRGGWYRWRK